MEATSITKMVKDAFYNIFFIIDVIVRNYNRIMLAVIKNSSKGDQGQVLNSSKGKLDEEILDPYFLAYPSHRMKVVSKYIFCIVN